MSHYGERLSEIAKKRTQLGAEEKRLIDQRKSEIGRLAEKYGLLTASDAFMNGMFTYAQKAVHENADIVSEWEASGQLTQKSRPAPPRNMTNKKNSLTQETARTKHDSHAFQSSPAVEKSQRVSVKT